MIFSQLLLRLEKIVHVLMSPRLFRALHIHRVLAGAEHRHILKMGLATVVDVGANRGQFTLAARRWAHQARIISFEPLADAAERFLKVFNRDSSVIFHQTAIGPEAGQETIHVSASDDSSSLLLFSPLQERLFPGTVEIRTETVNVGPLSDYVKPEQIVPPAMLKLDVQGYELEALRGCEDLLCMFAYVYVECSFVELYVGQALVDDIIAWLQERGWYLSGINNMNYDRNGRSIQADFLFENTYLKDAA